MDRHQLLDMLKTLLENNKSYIGLKAVCAARSRDVDGLRREKAVPGPKLNIFLIILSGILIISGIVCVVIKLPIFMLALTLLGGGLLALVIVMYIRRTKKWKMYLEEMDLRIAAAVKLLEEAEQAAQDYFDNVLKAYSDTVIPESFPEKYLFNIAALEYFIMLVTDLRADTIKEAINGYENQLIFLTIRNRLDIISGAASHAAAGGETAVNT